MYFFLGHVSKKNPQRRAPRCTVVDVLKMIMATRLWESLPFQLSDVNIGHKHALFSAPVEKG